MLTYYVYAYLDPTTKFASILGDYAPFYIGKGKELRYLKHLKENEETTENIRKFKKIQKIRKAGLEPLIVFIKGDMDENSAYNLEDDLILLFGRKDFEKDGILSNICLGARPPNYLGEDHPNYKKDWSPEWRKKQREAKSGKNHPNFGLHLSEVTRKKIGEANSGEKNGMYGKRLLHAKLTEEDVKAIRIEYNLNPESKSDIVKAYSQKFDVSKQTIWYIIYNKTWKNIIV